MALKILHIMSQLELTGAEVYAVMLANHQKSCGHSVTLLGDEIHIPCSASFVRCDIHNRNYTQRFQNLKRIRKIVKEQNIDVVHAHSRAASWLAHYALKGLKVPYVSTVHGRQHWHGRYKKNDVYGDQVITVCENIRQHLANEFGLDSKKIVTIRNPIEFKPVDSDSKQKFTLALLGRTSGPKGERIGMVIREVLPRLLQQKSELHVVVSGGAFENFDQKTKDHFVHLQKLYPNKLSYFPTEKFHEAFKIANVICASGRIAVEALSYGIPTFAFGEAVLHGFVTTDNLSECLKSNFGDVKADRDRDTAVISEQVEVLLVPHLFYLMKNKIDLNAEIQQKIKQEFAAEVIFKKIESIYHQNIFGKKINRWIPVLMYHKVSIEPLKTQHKIFVTKNTFEKQMNFLKKRGFETLDFSDLEHFLTGKKSLAEFPKRPIVLTFDDGYKDNLENAFPLLNRLGFKATVFVLSDFSIRNNDWDLGEHTTETAHPLMTQEELKQSLLLGISIGSHGRTHRALLSLTDQEAFQEIANSKQELEQNLQTKINVFAYPYGKFNTRHEEQVFTAGYQFGVATDSGGLRLEDNPFAIFRVNIFPDDLGLRFFKKAHYLYRKYFYWKRGR